ncbi:hypothetical protein B0H13DRAFT_2311740 [Mycena leptocephala]|nr:hypothetical protein B0H13DRAFT_2311740 [Mycena leptocephala]
MKFIYLMMQVLSIIFRITGIRASPERVYVGDEPLESFNCNTPGGTLVNITNNPPDDPTAVPYDFRMIPLGDIDLQYEIRVNNDTGVVDRLPERQGVRRIYSARIYGRKSRVTVAMYQGESAKEEWQRDIVQYMSVRFNPSDLSNTTVPLHRYLVSEYWLSQANHIFSCLQITSNFQDYVLLRRIEFEITLSATKENLPTGFLFLSPEEDFETGPSSFCWPDCAGYLAADPRGIQRLSTEHATQLGFASIQLQVTIEGNYWDANVYAGIRQFHQAKGFDPDSWDVAWHLAYPLFRLSLDEEEFGAEDDDDLDQFNIDTHAENSRKSESSGTESTARAEPPFLHGKIPAVSGKNFLALLMNVQLSVILFLGLAWLYNKM